MSQIKVFEFAKEIGLETLALMDKIREWKLPIKSHMVVLDDELMGQIKGKLAAEKDLKKVLKILPALKTPTISGLSDKGWYDVETIADEAIVRELIPELKKAGASGIIEYPLNKVIP
mgnify:CR=1 FL=1